MRFRNLLIPVLLCLLVGLGGVAAADEGENFITVDLPCLSDLDELPYSERDFYGDEWYETSCTPEVIHIPDGRPIYALLVNGYHQNSNFDMFHWYDFAKYLQSRGAYVHFAWWNNLLAPYMEKPLHDPDSVPSTMAFPLGTIYDAREGLDKAIPNDDYQFQADATAMLTAIRTRNQEAIIVLVGHSMGGNAVLRLAEKIDNTIVIDLLAPIDPVGNRSCIWDPWGTNPWTGWLIDDAFCNGFFNFTRWRAIRQDMMDDINHWWSWYPQKRVLGSNIKNLYHRWQQEFAPPYDYSCPGWSDDVPWPCGSFYGGFWESLIDPAAAIAHYTFNHHGDPTTSVPEEITGPLNVQSVVNTNLFSGFDVNVALGNWGGGLDGHGELVGFRGALAGEANSNFFKWIEERLGAIGGLLDIATLDWDDLGRLLNFESYALALEVPGGADWPSRDKEINPNDPNDPERLRRVDILMQWERDPFKLYKDGYEPWNPGLCMVSKDLVNIVSHLLPEADDNQPPTADAGSDRTVSADDNCIGHVELDGTGSSDPEDAELTYTWTWNDGAGSATGPDPVIELSLGEHEITLVVNDGDLDSDPDTVVITVEDTTPPVIESVTANPATLWPPNHQIVPVLLTVMVRDYCDPGPDVALGSVASNEPDDAQGGGDGHTTGDIQDAGIGTEDYSILLRAERQGGGNGRIYIITYSATDDAGNTSVSSTAVTVGHDQGEPSGPRLPQRGRRVN